MTEVFNAIDRVLRTLFPDDLWIERSDGLLTGEAAFEGETLAIVGTTAGAAIGANLALALARAVLDAVRDHPGRTILLVVDNGGHRLGRWDELMGNNQCIAHLTKCLNLARERGHLVIGLVHGLAVSAGFMATGMATTACFTLPGAELRVMAREAMARITKIPRDKLDYFCDTIPVLGPGSDNFVKIGGLDGVWDGDLREHLRAALQIPPDAPDRRRYRGAERGGRVHAAEIAALVRSGAP